MPYVVVGGAASCVFNAQVRIKYYFPTGLEVEGNSTPAVPPTMEQLVTHVPDLVVYRSHSAPLPQTIHSYGVVMFGDISGSYMTL